MKIFPIGHRCRSIINYRIKREVGAMQFRIQTMKGKCFRWTIIGAMLCGITTLQAQESVATWQNRKPPIAPAVEAPQPIIDLKRVSYSQLLEKTNPHDRERRMIKEALARRAQEQSLIVRQPVLCRQEVGAAIGQWQFQAGNTLNNRSPFPDARLDARTLHFPLPRNMTPGNRITGSRVSPSGQIKR